MSLRDLWRAVRRHRWLLLGTAAGVTALVMALTFLVPPRYESEAVLRIKSEDTGGGMLANLAGLADLGNLPDLGGNADVETEMGVLRSRRLADAITDSLALHLDLRRPRAPRTRVLRVLHAGEDAPRGVYSLRLQEDGGYTVSARRTRGPVQLPARVEIGEPFRVGNMTLALAPSLRADPPREVRFRVLPFRRVAKKVRKDIKVERQEGRSKLVEIRYRHRDPAIAAAVVNGVVRDFLDYKLNTERSDLHHNIVVLREQVASSARELREAEARLRTFQERHRIIAPEEQAELQAQRVAEIQVKRDAMQVERQALAERLNAIVQRAGHDGTEAPYRQLATFPSFITNGAVQDVLQTITELETERAQLLTLRTEQNLDVRTLSAQIQELEEQLYRLGTHYLESLDTQIAAASSALQRFGQELEQVPALEVQYYRLAYEREVQSKLHALLQTHLREAEVQEAIEDGGVRVVDYGIVADRPAFPKPWINLVLGGVLGLMLGLVSVVGRETVDSSVRSRSDVERATQGIPVLGVLPRSLSPRPHANGSKRRIRLWRTVPVPRIPPPEEPLVTRSDPWHPAAEAYRALRANLTFAGGEEPPRVLVLTSAAGEGRSEVAANLAITLAQQGTRTLLLDADLRDGSLGRVFGVEQAPGLAEVMLGRMPASTAIRELNVGAASTPLHFLPAGDRPAHPAEILESDRLRELLADLRQRFAAVVVAAPSLDRAADAAALARLADATVLIVRSGATDRDALEQAVAQLRRARVVLGGVVLSDFDAGLRAG